MYRLTVGFSTTATRIGNISYTEPKEDWEILLVVQNPEERAWAGKDLSGTVRDDVRVIEIPSLGVTKSRNKVLDSAFGTYLLFGDDDMVFNQENIELALDYLDQNPDVDLLLCQAENELGQLRKSYPKQTTELSKFNSGRAATYEMLVRVESLRTKNVRFDEDFGAGAKNYLGDEYILIADLLKAGGRAVFVPITIAMHPDDSSGARWGSDKDFNARLAILNRVFGPKAFAYRLAFAVRRRKELGSFSNVIRFALGKPKD